MKINKKLIIFTLFLFFVSINNVKATDASIILNGSTKIESGKTITIDVVASNNSGGLMSAGGTITTSNSSCLQFVSLSTPSGGTANGTVYAYSDMNGRNGNVVVARAVFKGIGTNCSATISTTNTKIAFVDGTKISKGTISKTIDVVTYSSNNNLSSINISAGSLSPVFNPSTTSYTINVGSSTTSINISATAQDAKSTISGQGTKNLNYGNNNVTLTVTAENGAKKQYNINIIRKDDRSSNTNLKKLNLSNGNISFSSNTLNYEIEVPFEVTKLNIQAEAEDSKSKVSINSPELIAEKTTNVTITVTAENGAKKTYTISVKRGKDPNKILNTDNNLLSITPSVGALSPYFDKEKTNYFVYLPYENEIIDFEYEVSDKVYGIVDKSGPERLKPDSANKYTIKVTAEDNSVKEYNITVYRAKNPELVLGTTHEIDSLDSLNIKNITIKNGKLTSKFEPSKTTYEYTRKKGFSYEYELEDETSYATTYETENDIYIVVENDMEQIKVYCLHKKETNIQLIIIILLFGISLIGNILLIYKLYNNNKVQKKKKDKKQKKASKK